MTTGRVAAIALGVLIVGLALHNVAMSALWDAGLRGNRLDVAAAWKEALLLGALGFVLWRVRRLPLTAAADRLALAYTVIVLLYAVIPQDWLGGEATTKGILLALRHHLIPVAAYALGRLAGIAVEDARRLLRIAVGTAVAVAVIGLIDVYLVPLDTWRDSGVPGWYSEQLGLEYRGLSGLPENWVYNTGDEQNPIRRLVSTFLSPLAVAYMLVVVLLYLATRPLTRWTVALGDRRLRRAPVDAHPGRTARARRRSGRARDRPADLVACDRRRGLGRRRGARARGVPVDRAVDELHRRGARVPPRARGADRRRERGSFRSR